MTCDAAMRPFRPINDTEIRCELSDYHDEPHRGVLRDYAGPGSETEMVWMDGDRRMFHGDWPGDCEADCILPADHDGRHAT